MGLCFWGYVTVTCSVYCNMSFWPLWRAFPPLDPPEGNNSWEIISFLSFFFYALDTNDWLLLGQEDIYWFAVCTEAWGTECVSSTLHYRTEQSSDRQRSATTERALQLPAAWMCHSSKEKKPWMSYYEAYIHIRTQILWHKQKLFMCIHLSPQVHTQKD